MFFGLQWELLIQKSIYYLASYAIIFLICIIGVDDYPKKLAVKLQNSHPVLISGVYPIYQVAINGGVKRISCVCHLQPVFVFQILRRSGDRYEIK